MIKKILAILAALATVFSLASCSVKNDKTTEELVSEQEAEYEQLIESMTQAEIERSEKINKSVNKFGKTEKGKRIVVELPYAHGKEYRVFEMDKNQECKYTINYYFFDNNEIFELNKKSKDKTKYDVDNETKMVAYKSEYESSMYRTYDELYDFYTSDAAIQNNYIVIE